jgi:HlyD family secretion protein
MFGSAIILSCADGNSTRPPDVKPLMEAVYASGHIVSDEEYQVFSQVDGILVEKPVKEGEKVAKGQVLFVIESEQQYARFRAAAEALQVARNNAREDGPALTEAREALETAHLKFQHDSIQFTRFQNLLRQNATSRAEYDRARLAYEAAASEWRMRSSSYKRLKSNLGVELQNAEASYKVASTEAGRHQIRSLMEGVVFKSTKEPGELVRRTEALGVVGKAQAYVFRMKVDEQDIIRIKSGQEVLIKIDAFPDRFFSGTVFRIYSMIDARDQSIRVDAVVNDSIPGHYSGLAAEGNIIVRKKEKAMVIPRTLLLPGDSLKVKTPQGIKTVKVVKGVETLNEVEIVSGIDPTSQLVIQ